MDPVHGGTIIIIASEIWELVLAKVYKRSIQPDKELETLSNVKDVQLRSD